MVARALRSPKRAVMPTLVAVRAAATKSAVLKSSPTSSMAAKPRTSGPTTPTTATDSEERPTFPSSTRSISRPTWSRRRMTPSSPRTRSTSSVPTIPSTDGPMMMPATISPTTAGMPMRSATSAANLAATRTTRMSVRMLAMSICLAPPSSAPLRDPVRSCRCSAPRRSLRVGADPDRQNGCGPSGLPSRVRLVVLSYLWVISTPDGGVCCASRPGREPMNSG